MQFVIIPRYQYSPGRCNEAVSSVERREISARKQIGLGVRLMRAQKKGCSNASVCLIKMQCTLPDRTLMSMTSRRVSQP